MESSGGVSQRLLRKIHHRFLMMDFTHDQVLLLSSTRF
jgi:hypothetical protein